jgi:hypothetical protein
MVDLVGGLTAAKLAIDLAKDLREIDRSVDEATFKLKLAELTSALAEAQVALSDAKIRIGELEQELSDYRLGKICPKCRVGHMQLESETRHTYGGLGNHGVKDRRYVCNDPECGFGTEEVIDPYGLVKEHVKKRN